MGARPGLKKAGAPPHKKAKAAIQEASKLRAP